MQYKPFGIFFVKLFDKKLINFPGATMHKTDVSPFASRWLFRKFHISAENYNSAGGHSGQPLSAIVRKINQRFAVVFCSAWLCLTIHHLVWLNFHHRNMLSVVGLAIFLITVVVVVIIVITGIHVPHSRVVEG